jgi:hypothetical protein
MSTPKENQYDKLVSKEPIPLEKKRELANKSGICMFLIHLFITIPIWIGFLLPLTIVYVLLEKLFCMCCKKKKIQKKFIPLESVSGPDPNKNSREFDLILFGATGFTGKFAAEYLAKNYFVGPLSASEVIFIHKKVIKEQIELGDFRTKQNKT